MHAYYLVIAGSLLNMVGTSIYILRTLRGQTKPNKMTFLMWAIAPMIGTAAALSTGVTWATLPVFVAGFMPFCIFLASFVNPNAYWQLNKLDYVCGFLSGLALVLWFLTSEPVVAIVFAIISDAFASYPTLIKAWKYPETEHWTGFAGSAISPLTSFAVAVRWNFATLAFPTYLFFMMSMIAFGVVKPKLFRGK